MEEKAPELSPPALGVGGGVARPGAGRAHVTLAHIGGKSGCVLGSVPGGSNFVMRFCLTVEKTYVAITKISTEESYDATRNSEPSAQDTGFL
jgi:hypothetical protein